MLGKLNKSIDSDLHLFSSSVTILLYCWYSAPIFWYCSVFCYVLYFKLDLLLILPFYSYGTKNRIIYDGNQRRTSTQVRTSNQKRQFKRDIQYVTKIKCVFKIAYVNLYLTKQKKSNFSLLNVTLYYLTKDCDTNRWLQKKFTKDTSGESFLARWAVARLWFDTQPIVVAFRNWFIWAYCFRFLFRSIDLSRSTKSLFYVFSLSDVLRKTQIEY